jgi:hypothetical protein
MDYFEAAMKRIPSGTTFVVFSDDINWCRENFSKDDKNILFIEGNLDYEDISLMSLCDHNIISNSTFSWWAAWLNDNPSKIVIAPKNWFGPAYSNLSTEDLYCPGWLVI